MSQRYWLLPAVFAVLCSLPTTLCAQRSEIWREKPGTWLLSAGTGPTHYAGDLSRLGNLAHLQLGGAIKLAGLYRASYQLSYRVEAQLYYIYAQQKYTQNYYNNLSFHAMNPDAWAGIQYDLWRVDDRYRAVIPYLLLGGGATYMTPKARYQGNSYSLAPLQTEGVGYNRLAGIVRYGIGVPLQTTERFRLHLEGTYTHVLSDYLDDVSTVYIDRTNMDPLRASLSDRRAELGTTLNEPGEQRGNTGKNDGYFVLSAHLVFVIITPGQRSYRRQRGL